IPVRAALVRLEHVRRARSQRTIRKQLDRPDADPIAADAGAHTPFTSFAQLSPSDAVVDAQRQFARGFERLEGVPRAAILQIVDAGQPSGGRQWQRGTDCGAERLVARLGYAGPHQVLSLFE